MPEKSPKHLHALARHTSPTFLRWDSVSPNWAGGEDGGRQACLSNGEKNDWTQTPLVDREGTQPLKWSGGGLQPGGEFEFGIFTQTRKPEEMAGSWKASWSLRFLFLPSAPVDMGVLTITRGHKENNESYFSPTHLERTVEYFYICFVLGPGVWLLQQGFL